MGGNRELDSAEGPVALDLNAEEMLEGTALVLEALSELFEVPLP